MCRLYPAGRLSRPKAANKSDGGSKLPRQLSALSKTKRWSTPATHKEQGYVTVAHLEIEQNLQIAAMWLVNCDKLKLEYFGDEDCPPYAILSHTWGHRSEEVSFRDMETQNFDAPKNDKLQQTARLTKERGLTYFWDDTCCIDKSSSAELSEAINSMFKWYRNSEICFAHLSDFEVTESTQDTDQLPHEIATCRWFTRGWTLQELIAPSDIEFFDKNWRFIGRKSLDLNCVISGITKIPTEVLDGSQDLQQCAVAQRMSWASSRATTRSEDIAYCLLGIFDINMALLYGEGPKAFRRLLQRILETTEDFSIFAWEYPALSREDIVNAPTIGVLPDSPASYHGMHELRLDTNLVNELKPAQYVGSKVDGHRIHMTLYRDFEDPEPHRRMTVLGYLNCNVLGYRLSLRLNLLQNIVDDYDVVLRDRTSSLVRVKGLKHFRLIRHAICQYITLMPSNHGQSSAWLGHHVFFRYAFESTPFGLADHFVRGLSFRPTTDSNTFLLGGVPEGVARFGTVNPPYYPLFGGILIDVMCKPTCVTYLVACRYLPRITGNLFDGSICRCEIFKSGHSQPFELGVEYHFSLLSKNEAFIGREGLSFDTDLVDDDGTAFTIRVQRIYNLGMPQTVVQIIQTNSSRPRNLKIS